MLHHQPAPPSCSVLLLVVWCEMWQWIVHFPGFSAVQTTSYRWPGPTLTVLALKRSEGASVSPSRATATNDEVQPHRQTDERHCDGRYDDAGRVARDAVHRRATPCFHSGLMNSSWAPGVGSLSAITYSRPIGPIYKVTKTKPHFITTGSGLPWN